MFICSLAKVKISQFTTFLSILFILVSFYVMFRMGKARAREFYDGANELSLKQRRCRDTGDWGL